MYTRIIFKICLTLVIKQCIIVFKAKILQNFQWAIENDMSCKLNCIVSKMDSKSENFG